MEHKPGSNSGYLLRVSVGGARIDGQTELLVATHQMETSLLKHKRSKTLPTKDLNSDMPQYNPPKLTLLCSGFGQASYLQFANKIHPFK